mgnify:FL=1
MGRERAKYWIIWKADMELMFVRWMKWQSELEKRGEICFRKIVDRFGEAVVGTDGELDRKKLGEIVFSDEGKRKILNEIVHPPVLDYVKKDIEKRKKEGRKLYVLESALLAEAGQELCDKIWYIYTEENVRRIRLERSRGYTQEKITQMMHLSFRWSNFVKIVRM